MKARGFDTCFCPAWEQKGRSQIFWGDGSGKAASSLAEETEGVWSDCPPGDGHPTARPCLPGAASHLGGRSRARGSPAVGALSWQRGKAAEQGVGMSSPQTGAHSSSFYFHFWSYLASRQLACSHLPRALSGDQYSPGAPMPSAIWAVQARADGAGHPQHLLELLLGRGQVVTSPTSALVCAP